MAREGSGLSGLISAAIFIGMEVAAFALLSLSSPMQNIWLTRFSHRTMAALWGSYDDNRSKKDLREENNALADENMRLRLRLQQYEADGALALAQANAPVIEEGFRYTSASVIKMSRNNQHNYIILDKGSEDGIHPQDGIITSTGVIGIIDAVDRHCCYGITLMNLDMKFSARIGHDGAAGPLSWDGLSRDRAWLHALPLQCAVSEGDTVMTSGYSAIFPPDIPLGIAGESKIINGSTKDVEVRLFQDYSSVRYVTIVENLAYENIRVMEGRVEGKNRK